MDHPNESKGQTPADVDKALEELQSQAKKAGQLAERLGSESEELEGASDQLIDDVAQNLATMREAAGLPSKDVDQLKKKIRARQNSR